jgi:hypothetical protein
VKEEKGFCTAASVRVGGVRLPYEGLKIHICCINHCFTSIEEKKASSNAFLTTTMHCQNVPIHSNHTFIRIIACHLLYWVLHRVQSGSSEGTCTRKGKHPATITIVLYYRLWLQ